MKPGLPHTYQQAVSQIDHLDFPQFILAPTINSSPDKSKQPKCSQPLAGAPTAEGHEEDTGPPLMQVNEWQEPHVLSAAGRVPNQWNTPDTARTERSLIAAHERQLEVQQSLRKEQQARDHLREQQMREQKAREPNNRYLPKISLPIYWDMPIENSQIYSTQNEHSTEGQQSWDPNLLEPSQRGIDNGMTSIQNSDESEQKIQPLLIEKDKTLFTGAYMPQSKSPSLQFNPNSKFEAAWPISHAHPYDLAWKSPSRTDFDWFRDGSTPVQGFEGGSSSRSSPHLSQGGSETVWHSKTQVQLAVPIIKHINLGDIQGFADPQEVTFQHDEGYVDIDTKSEGIIEVEIRRNSSQRFRSHYRHPIDEGFDQSVKDKRSPIPNTSDPVPNRNVETDGKANADSEDVDEEGKGLEINEGKVSSAGIKRRQQTWTSLTPQIAKKRGVTKNPLLSKSKLPCKDYHHNTRDSTELAS
jgi:hypothetical protein